MPGLILPEAKSSLPGMRGLTHWWPLNDAFSGLSRPGVGPIYGTNTTITPADGPPFSAANTAANFTATASAIILSAAPTASWTGVFTASFWLYLSSFTTWDGSAFGRYISWDSGGTDVLAIIGGSVNGNGSFDLRSVQAGTTTLTQTSLGSLFALNSWNHVVVTGNNASLNLYVNGKSASLATGGNAVTTVSTSGIGCRAAATRAPSGRISDVRFCNGTQWTAAEVADLYYSAFRPTLEIPALFVSAASVLEAQPHFIGRMWPQSVQVLASLRQNLASDISGPLGTQPETNTHFVGRFQPPQVSVLQGYRQNPALDVPPLILGDDPPAFIGKLQMAMPTLLRSLRENQASDASSQVTKPETNTHFIGKFAVPANWLLRLFRENQASDATSLAPQPATNTSFIGKFWQSTINLLPALRQNTANDFSTATTQPETNVHFIGRFVPPVVWSLIGYRQNIAADVSSQATPETNTHFIGRFMAPVINLLPWLRQNTANDTSSSTIQSETNTHWVGRFTAPLMTLLRSTRENQADDLPVTAAPDNPTNFIGRFSSPVIALLRSLRENPASDTSAQIQQPDTSTHFVGRFVQTAIRLLPAVRQNAATDLGSAVAKVVTDWLVRARRRGKR